MRLVAVAMAKNEAGIIGSTVRHLYAEGVDVVVVEDGHSTDQTRAVALQAGAVVYTEATREYRQGERMTGLAAEHCEPGDWCIPFDADEFWYSPLGTIAEALKDTDAHICWARMWLHRDWDHRAPNPKPLGKVAFRYQPGAVIEFGNHGVSLPAGGTDRWGVLEIREWQNRSLAHFKAKVARQRELIANTPGMNTMFGAHMNRLVDLTDDEVEAEYEALVSGEWVYDPIPSEFRCPA